MVAKSMPTDGANRYLGLVQSHDTGQSGGCTRS